MINLAVYSRKDLSNFLQLAQDAYNAGHPLPCWVVEQVVDMHDKLLHSPDVRPPTAKASSKPSTQRSAENHTETKHRKKIQVGAISGKSCGRHSNTLLHRAECGKIFCPDCMDEGRV